VRIVSDRNIPFVEHAFADLGQVTTLPAAELDASAVRDADMLLCRTTIKVGPALLDGSRVRFVATATIGTDHLDLAYLRERGITWASAPGSNADSVALWFACALAHVCERERLDLGSLRVGVVGVGHVGRRIAALARALGVTPLLCDPPRARTEGATGFVPLETVLAEADVVSLHVPLTEEGPDRTRGLLDEHGLARLRRGALVVNACRGEVVDGAALADAIDGGRVRAVLDVFPGEPSPDPALVRRALLVTPHVAGHSLDGKVNGTDAIYRAACAFLGREPTTSVASLLPALEPSHLAVDAHNRSDAEVLGLALRPFYDIARDDAALREIVTRPAEERGRAFRTYRDHYAVRREPKGATITLNPRRARLASVLERLGAQVR
jgi:erythronate-4-phosphate dehydrogenase